MADSQHLHRWIVTPREAITLQKDLRSKVIIEKLARPVRTIAGCDISADKHSDSLYAGIVVLKFPDLIECTHASAVLKTTFPYIPGLLSFRESPAILKAWENLNALPDIMIVDGQGFAHPRRFGSACHIGVLLDIPTIGCAKSWLTGKYTAPPAEAGTYSPLVDGEETIGAVLRTVDNVKPMFVSIGHRITLEDAIGIVIRCSSGYRVPEPTRQAHILVKKLQQGEVPRGPLESIQE